MFPPATYDQSIGQFETDKIVGVTETQLLIERTTWCKSMAKGRRRGLTTTFRISNSPIDLTGAEDMVVLVDRGKTKTANKKTMVAVTFDRVSVLSASYR